MASSHMRRGGHSEEEPSAVTARVFGDHALPGISDISALCGCTQAPEDKEASVRKAPATHAKASAALLIEGFKRPFTDKAAAALLSQHGDLGALLLPLVSSLWRHV